MLKYDWSTSFNRSFGYRYKKNKINTFKKTTFFAQNLKHVNDKNNCNLLNCLNYKTIKKYLPNNKIVTLN